MTATNFATRMNRLKHGMRHGQQVVSLVYKNGLKRSIPGSTEKQKPFFTSY